jgi:hypothetical protein
MNLFATKFPVPESQIPVNNSKEAEVAKKTIQYGKKIIWKAKNLQVSSDG